MTCSGNVHLMNIWCFFFSSFFQMLERNTHKPEEMVGILLYRPCVPWNGLVFDGCVRNICFIKVMFNMGETSINMWHRWTWLEMTDESNGKHMRWHEMAHFHIGNCTQTRVSRVLFWVVNTLPSSSAFKPGVVQRTVRHRCKHENDIRLIW